MNAPIAPRLYPALPDDAFAPGGAPPGQAARSFADAFALAFGDASAALQRADASERGFAAGKTGLQEMVLDRAQADVALSLASAAATRMTTALTTILGMQV